MRLVSIVGARPQFIKLAPVSRALREWHEEIIVHTGQHYDYVMSAQFFKELALPAPDYNLEVGSGMHGAQTARMLEGIERVLVKVRPDGVVVFGDTNSTLAGALAAAKLSLPVMHIEAGMRSFNRAMPEEINRMVTDHLSTRLFCPTERGREYLEREGIMRGVEVVGDVMYDLLLAVKPLLAERAQDLLPSLGVKAGSYLLVTVHRASNTENPQCLHTLASVLNELEMPVIFPVHPRTRRLLEGCDICWGVHVQLIEPVGYIEMLALEQAAYRIITDSGGVQKEAFLQRVPCITLREETEWPETVEAGWNTLIDCRQDTWQDICAAIHRPEPRPVLAQPFGQGDAARRIALSLC